MSSPQASNFFWELNTLHSDQLHCIVPKLCFTQSVLSIYLCIQLHKYTCNVSQVWHFLLGALESIFKNPHSTWLECDIRQSFESDHPAIKFLPWCRIQKLYIPHCYRLANSFNNEHVLVRNLSDLTLHIVLDAWWASMNVGSKACIG